MSEITVKDGTTIYYKDWGKGPVVTFSHGWPLNSDMWDGQMLFLAEHGFRVVAHDRRGHGRSSQPWSGNDMDGYADDLAAVIETLDLEGITMVGHSTGGGEVARYIGRYGTKRLAKAVLIAAVPPLMLKTAANPEGLPMEVFDGLRSGVSREVARGHTELSVREDSTEFRQMARHAAEPAVGWSLAQCAIGAQQREARTEVPEVHQMHDRARALVHGNLQQVAAECHVADAIYGCRLAYLKVRKSSGTLLKFIGEEN